MQAPAVSNPSDTFGPVAYEAVSLASTDWVPALTNFAGAPTRWLMLGTGGTIMVDGPCGGTNVPVVLPAGLWRMSVTKIYKIGTTATGIAAGY